MELAGDNDHRLRNILVLFQSLDADGNPENGISIPDNAAAALSASINLDSEPAAFAASPELQKVREAAGISGPIKTPCRPPVTSFRREWPCSATRSGSSRMMGQLP